MKLTKTKLKQIIKEEITKALNEAGVKDFIKDPNLHSSIPFSVLPKVLADNPELKQMAANPADPAGQQRAFAKIAELFANAQDPNSGIRLGDAMDVQGFLKYAEQKQSFLFR